MDRSGKLKILLGISSLTLLLTLFSGLTFGQMRGASARDRLIRGSVSTEHRQMRSMASRPAVRQNRSRSSESKASYQQSAAGRAIASQMTKPSAPIAKTVVAARSSRSPVETAAKKTAVAAKVTPVHH